MPDRFSVQLHERVTEDFGEEKARELISAYDQARSRLEREVYDHIRGREPSLTDHGTRHIGNVQDNVVALLSEKDRLADLSGIELYCLGMLILFHDAGNVYGREDHQNNVATVFDRIRGTQAALRREKTLVVRAARAHTGTAQDGSPDTLKEVAEVENLEGQRVRLRELAALLRFADELAEGPQRTSDFMRNEGLYGDAASEIYHEYASSTHIFIDRAIGRVAIDYEIDLRRKKNDDERRVRLTRILGFVYERLMKLDQERQYARYYSRLLSPFRSTEAKFNFHCGEQVLDVEMSPLKLADAVVMPGGATRQVSAIDGEYAVESLVPRLLEQCPQEAE